MEDHLYFLLSLVQLYANDIVCVLLEFALWDSHYSSLLFFLYNIIKHDGVLMLLGFFVSYGCEVKALLDTV